MNEIFAAAAFLPVRTFPSLYCLRPYCDDSLECNGKTKAGTFKAALHWPPNDGGAEGCVTRAEKGGLESSRSVETHQTVSGR